MPRLLDSSSRTATLVDAINVLLAEGGPAALTMRAIADTARLSTSSLTHHYRTRERLMSVVCARTAAARREQLLERLPEEGALAVLPRTDDDVLDARAWLGWLEMWRSDDLFARIVRESRQEEKALFAQATDFVLCRDRLDEAWALVDGLVAAICAPVAPLRPTRARALLAAHLRRAGVETLNERSWLAP